MTQRDLVNSPTHAVDPEAERQTLALAALGEVLLPAARLMIANGVQLPAMVEVLKQVMVIEATHATRNERYSDTRVSVLTGVHRKDVKRLSDQVSSGVVLQVDDITSVGSQVVGRWISDARFLDAQGAPLPLARTPRYAVNNNPSFSELVSVVSKDVGARAVLDALVRLDVVRAVGETVVELRMSGFVPSSAARESLHFLASNVSDHLASAVHNQSTQPVGGAMLEQSAFSKGLSREQADKLHNAARVWWAKALKHFLQEATLAEAIQAKNGEPSYRVRFGAYFYQTQQEDGQIKEQGIVGASEVKTAVKKR